MKLSKLFGNRLREDPKDAQLISHKLMLRGGFIRQNAAGIFSYMPLGYKVMQKITQIIREEMDAIDGQEMLMPYVNPKEMWEQTGRYQTIGDELLRFKDRNDHDYVLAMTHEESVAFLAKSELFSYKQFPFMVYQFQLKFRDEPRARGGLIRVREFTMKDAYSFHLNWEDLDKYYYKVFNAYNNVFKRVGLKKFIDVKSDTGMMGGRIAHEFMLVTESGEDTLILCKSCGYRANREVATSNLDQYLEEEKPLELIETPGKKTIEEVAEFLNVPLYKTGKAVFYADDNDNIIFVLIRGDKQVNETKLKNYLKTKYLRFAEDEEIKKIGAVAGYASPLSINDNDKLRIIVDTSILTSNNLVVGANKENYHYKNFNFKRDLNKGEVVEIYQVEQGEKCPKCGKPLKVTRGIEIGNIFQLGDKYTKAYNIQVLDENGKKITPLMCSYGIGVGRLAAAIIEESHDKFGMIWPKSVAPMDIHILPLTKKEEVFKFAFDLYDELRKEGFDCIIDDRKESPGVKFNDADLIGIPLQVIISDKTYKEGEIEIKIRKTGERKRIKIHEYTYEMVEKIKNIYATID